jgi:hypothetical protein
MSDKLAINDYLTRLDRSLGAVPAADRAEIVLEIRSHLLEAKEKDPTAAWPAIFAQLGEPEQVANRYLRERGLKMQKPPKTPVLKWLVIGLLGTFTFFVAVIAVLLFSFTPLIKVDESTGRVQLLGGAIDVQAKNVITQLSKEGSFVFGSINGVEKLPDDIKDVQIKFGTGELRIDYNSTDELNWDCDGAGKSSTVKVMEAEGKAVLDFSMSFVDCDVSIPNKNVSIEGLAGQIEVRLPQQNLDIKFGSGEVNIKPDPKLGYIYDLKTGMGKISGDFESTAKEGDGKKITVGIQTGQINKLD